MGSLDDHSNPPANGDQSEAMVRLAKHWTAASPRLEAFVYTLVHDPHDADDVIQATGEYVARHFHEYKEGTSFIAWAITIARYRIQHLWNAKKKHQQIISSQAIEALAIAASNPAHNPSALHAALRACVASLQPRQRKLVELRYLHDLKPGAIADRLGQRANTISAALMRIRQSLRSCVDARIDAEQGGDR